MVFFLKELFLSFGLDNTLTGMFIADKALELLKIVWAGLCI